MRTTAPLTESTRTDFLRQAEAWRPHDSAASVEGLDRLIAWTGDRDADITPLPAERQATVAFGIGDLVLWRAYPGQTVAHKVVLLPGLRGHMSGETRAALVAALEAAVPDTRIESDGHLECPLASLADGDTFARFTVVLAAALAVARQRSST